MKKTAQQVFDEMVAGMPADKVETRRKIDAYVTNGLARGHSYSMMVGSLEAVLARAIDQLDTNGRQDMFNFLTMLSTEPRVEA